MGTNWKHLKAFLKRRDATAPTSNEKNFITSTEKPDKLGLDVHEIGDSRLHTIQLLERILVELERSNEHLKILTGEKL